MTQSLVRVTGASVPLTTPVSTEPPSEFLIWAFGETRFRWLDGREHAITLDAATAQCLMERYARVGHDLPIDYNHASTTTVDDRQARAAGSFEVELRGDGLWAVNVRWTADAEGYIRRREYRYVSPTWNEDKDGPVELVNLALTANPATLGARPLVATSTPTAPAGGSPGEAPGGKEATVKVANLIGLPETAGEAEVSLRIAALANFEASVLQRLDDAPDRETAMGRLEALAATAAQAELLAEKVKRLEAEREDAEREQLIASATRDGKLAPAQAADGGWARTTPLATLRAFLASAPRIIPTGEAGKADTASSTGDKTWDEMDGPERAALFLEDPARYQELRKAALGR